MTISLPPSTHPAHPALRPRTISTIRPAESLPTYRNNFFDDYILDAIKYNYKNYVAIFDWFTRTTGRKSAYQTPEAIKAYIKSLKGKSQQYYDPAGFLHSIGICNVESYGRERTNYTGILKYFKDYRPNEWHSPFQKTMIWLWKKSPRTVFLIMDTVDPKLRREGMEESWNKTEIPQPPIPDDAKYTPADPVANRYYGTSMKKLGRTAPIREPFFDWDMHLGIPSALYGTYAAAKSLGFTDEQALRIGKANNNIDLNSSPYGKTRSLAGHTPSRHFNLNVDHPEKGDTRFIWAKRHLDAAIELAKRGLFEQAEHELGYGLHSVQDAFAHAQTSPLTHAILGNIPDYIEYNPVATYEGTLATKAYLMRYLSRISANRMMLRSC